MGRNLDPKCKKCRREGDKLFLKGERCFTAKCAVVKRKYPPGIHGVKRPSRLSEYGQQLRAKQKLKRSYSVLEHQFINYYKSAKNQKGDTGATLVELLESRLDNVIYRLGFIKSRNLARQLVSHGHFLVNDKRINIPSYQIKVGDTIKIREKSLQLAPFKNLIKFLEKHKLPEWIMFDKDKLEAKILNKPKTDDLKESFNVNLIIEYYSR